VLTGTGILVTIAAADFLLPLLAALVYILVLLNVIAQVPQALDVVRLGDRVDAVAVSGAVTGAMIEDLNSVLTDEVQHQIAVLAGDRDSITRHETHSLMRIYKKGR
jgi:hypothetical protein